MMSNPVSKFFMAAVVIYVMTITAVWADRILVDDPHQTVTVGGHFSCHRPVDITIDSADPALYEADSAQLQKLTDSVRAMLAYECPGLSSIHLTGLIRGLDDIVYQGEMLRNNNWLVTPVASEDRDVGTDLDSGTFSGKSDTPRRYDDELKPGQLDVTGMHLGMTVAQVKELVIQHFGMEPHYDENEGVMTMDTGQCPADLTAAHADPEIDSKLKCLKAWFSDNRVARLQRLNLFQVVDGQLNQVNALLVNKYGSPMQTHSADDNSEVQMIWRALNTDARQSVIQEVDATVRPVGNRLVATNVALYNTHSTDEHHEGFADLDLKL